jgi:periplasmic protein TonB
MATAEALEMLPRSAVPGMNKGLAFAAALHLAAATAMLAWPAAVPIVEAEQAVEIVFAPPPPAAEPPAAVEPVKVSAPQPKAATPLPITAARPKPAAPAASVTDRTAAAEATPATAAPALTTVATAAPAPAAPEPVAAPDTAPAALDMPRPHYPRIARQRGWEGVVVLAIEVNELGCPNTVTVKRSSGHAPLDEAAMEAARRWHFQPARKGGSDIVAVVDVPIRFSLSEG